MKANWNKFEHLQLKKRGRWVRTMKQSQKMIDALTPYVGGKRLMKMQAILERRNSRIQLALENLNDIRKSK